MTTNRMGLEQTLSDERLEQYANDKRMCNVNDEIREMARELLARRRANKPVMFIDGDISPSDAEKLAAAIREFNSEPSDSVCMAESAPQLQTVMAPVGEQKKQELIEFIRRELPYWSPEGEYYQIMEIALAALAITPVTVPDEKLFSDEFWRMVDENNKDIDIGQLGYDNCNALCKAAYQAACNSISKSVTNEP